MSEELEFQEDQSPPLAGGRFILDLDGYEGPIDILLQLAREQKLDLTRISILALADQYLAFIRQARQLRLEIAADYLVMAAWLAYLKSRLLLPVTDDDEEPSGVQLAAALRFQLQRLEAMQEAGRKVIALPRLGREVFARGEVEPLRVVVTPAYDVSLFELLQAYARHSVRVKATSLRIAPSNLYSVDDAIRRLSGLLGEMPTWRSLLAFLPTDLHDALHRRSALASTFAATLEMAKSGKLRLRQDGTYGPIYLCGAQDSP